MDILSVQSTTLPSVFGLNIAALTRLFAKTTNSYKFVFFLSYLDILKRKEFNTMEPISFRELMVEMLANTWYPHTYFKLSFGLQDLITTKLDLLKLDIGEPILKFKDTDKKLLRTTINNQVLDDSLMRYVPFRTLRPFFEEELKGVVDYKVDSTIAELSIKHFTERKPLYSFTNRGDAIIPNPLWTNYFKLHFSIIRSWTAWHWLEYMQSCNQAVPAISAKLFPPQERDSLKTQAEYWKLVIKHSAVKCIYSGENLNADRISLDHFVPWSFVAHDLLWNVIPTLPEVNSAKSNCLPANSYFDRFVALQHLGLTISNKHAGEQKWEKYVEPFLADLRVGKLNDLLDYGILKSAYEATLKPQLELAKTLGFPPNWNYRPTQRELN
jgi:hypothetical protein